MVVAATGIGLIAVDVALMLAERRRAKRRS
jgi:hypothetical protein